jgi:hypothetical protein
MRRLSSLITATAIFGMIGSALAAGQYGSRGQR